MEQSVPAKLEGQLDFAVWNGASSSSIGVSRDRPGKSTNEAGKKRVRTRNIGALRKNE